MVSRPNIALIKQELKELGGRRALFRIGWEARRRSGYFAWRDRQHDATWSFDYARIFWRARRRLHLGEPSQVIARIAPSIDAAACTALARDADAALEGKIRYFGRWMADLGQPIDWHLNPVSGLRWPEDAHWSRVTSSAPEIGDIKFTWEAGRFPQAYLVARAATFFPRRRVPYVAGFMSHVQSFIENNPLGEGVHWNSGQEIAFRLLAWTFALHVFNEIEHDETLSSLIPEAFFCAADHIERYISYAHHAVYNNHILSEALGLYWAGHLFAATEDGERWQRRGRDLLDEQIGRQFYGDGSYIQQSHNYQRLALQNILWACRIASSFENEIPSEWLLAARRSLDFLTAQQNGSDGRLPNYGANDGALPAILSTCDFSDFRPTLQAISWMANGARRYPAGPWDEEAAWWGMDLDAAVPLSSRRIPEVYSPIRGFKDSGYYVMRFGSSENFAMFRCGTLRDRFSQIDMLHLDVWWRGHNVLVDGGTYLYNASPAWNAHFHRTESHNTVAVDGLDQMVHHRQFKNVYWTAAAIISSVEQEKFAQLAGEHRGYCRYPGLGVHRRSILHLKDEVWVVVDHLEGSGQHRARLHWLAGQFPWRFDGSTNQLTLATPRGPFCITVIDTGKSASAVSVVEGQTDPPRGWLSRYYGEKIPTPSLAAELVTDFPLTWITLLAPPAIQIVSRSNGHESAWHVVDGNRARTLASFTICEGSMCAVMVS